MTAASCPGSAGTACALLQRGLILLQSGNDRGAFDLWIDVIRSAPADAEWLPGLRAQARELAVKLNLDPKTAVP